MEKPSEMMAALTNYPRQRRIAIATHVAPSAERFCGKTVVEGGGMRSIRVHPTPGKLNICDVADYPVGRVWGLFHTSPSIIEILFRYLLPEGNVVYVILPPNYFGVREKPVKLFLFGLISQCETFLDVKMRQIFQTQMVPVWHRK